MQNRSVINFLKVLFKFLDVDENKPQNQKTRVHLENAGNQCFITPKRQLISGFSNFKMSLCSKSLHVIVLMSFLPLNKKTARSFRFFFGAD